jgi:hypothetical protein
MGYILMIQGVGETLDPFLDNVLSKNIQIQSGIKAIQIGNNIVEFNEKFRYEPFILSVI